MKANPQKQARADIKKSSPPRTSPPEETRNQLSAADAKRVAEFEASHRKTLNIVESQDGTWCIYNHAGKFLKEVFPDQQKAEAHCASIGVPFVVHRHQPLIPSFGAKSLADYDAHVTPSISELIYIACQLSTFDGAKQPSNYFPNALELWRQGASFLKSSRLDTITHTFEELIKPLPDGQDGTGRKKQKTMVGEITTIKGLEEAIEREFGMPDSALIISRRTMTERERLRLLESITARRKRTAAKQRRTS